jgi:CDP-glucose 4,6-dehydratase
MLEKNENSSIDPTFWLNRRVVVTNHTGFLGIWIACWLRELGADAIGLSPNLAAVPAPGMLTGLEPSIDGHDLDLRDRARVAQTLEALAPEVIIHLAADSAVAGSDLKRPLEQFDSIAAGTLNLLEAARRVPRLRAALVVTGDSVYRPAAASRRESDPLGAPTPRAASLACAELIVQTFRHCYLSSEDGIGLASLRACMLVGGGDFTPGRPVPELVRAIAAARPPALADPGCCPPFLHVLDALHATLLLTQAVARRPQHLARAWNLAPDPSDAWPLSRIAERLRARMGGASPRGEAPPGAFSPPRLAAPGAAMPPSATLPCSSRLDGRALAAALGWRPLLEPETALDWTADGYRRLDTTADAGFIAEQIARFRALATTRPETAVDADLGLTLDRGRGLGRLPMPMPMPQRKASHAATLA